MTKRRVRGTAWSRLMGQGLAAIGQIARAQGRLVARKAARQLMKPAVKAARKAALKTAPRPAAKKAKPKAPAGAGDWLSGLALGAGGARRWHLHRPPGVARGERLPLLVLLHGCQQDGAAIAASSGLNRLANRERCLVLYPEQDRLANAQGCWNWFQTDNGRAQVEAALILQAVDQVCQRHGADPARVAVAGLSAGASMAALLGSLHPGRFQAVVMHSGVPPGTAHSTLTALRAMRGRRATAPLSAAGPGAVGLPALLVVHGDADAVVSPHNAQAAVQAWADAAGARARPPRRVQRGQRLPMTLSDHTLRGRTVATLALVHGLGHAWSGGAAGQPFSDPRGPDAARLLWAFVAKCFAAATSPA